MTMVQNNENLLTAEFDGHRAKYILVTSCKGGVGKSTCAVNLSVALSRRGMKVLLCDCDFDMRCLDLMLGLENEVVYDIYDAACGRISVDKAVMKVERFEGLDFLAAPLYSGNELSAEELKSLFFKADELGKYDYIILDTPGALVSDKLLDMGNVDMALIVASHQPASLRAADKTGEYLLGRLVKEQRLIINSFDMDSALKGTRPGINEMIDRSFIRLGGMIPYDKELLLATERGELLTNGNTATAFDNTARRLMGKNVPLFENFKGLSVKRKIKRLFK